jgi:peroxiredoxin
MFTLLTRGALCFAGGLVLLFSSSSIAATPTPMEISQQIPHVGQKAREGYVEYSYGDSFKAFVIAPGGAWSWWSGANSETEAVEIAMRDCQKHTLQDCVPYSVNDEVVFDRDAWSTLWRPYYSTLEKAKTTKTGTREGQRFPDIMFRDLDGHKKILSEYQGKVVIVHFWGSWCPPCLREFPNLQKFYTSIQQQNDVELLMLQVREPVETSLAWAQRHGFSDLPLYNSKVSTQADTRFSLADGSSIDDRVIAPVFPSSYILDPNGVILFRHKGPIKDWLEYLPFLEDVTLAQ